MSALVVGVRDLLDAVVIDANGSDRDLVRKVRRRLDEPLRVAVAGRVKAGKSTLLNALLGQSSAATDRAECTRMVTTYRHGTEPRAWAVAGTNRAARRFVVDASGARVDLQPDDETSFEHLEVELPAEPLRNITLIDTPGNASLSQQVSARAVQFLAPDDGPQEADVIVYLLRYLHETDAEFLEAFSELSPLESDPLRAIGVLSRADELGSGRGDALAIARIAASRLAASSAIRPLVSDVLPASGLLATSAYLLQPTDFEILETLASLDSAALDRLFLSADRFLSTEVDIGWSVEDRRHLIDLVGMFGIRLAIDLMERGTVTALAELRTELEAISGIAEIRTLLLDRYTARADALKAARALASITAVLHRINGPSRNIHLTTLDRILADAHELDELRWLREIHEGRHPTLEPELIRTLRQALGEVGLTPARRAGLGDSASAAEVETQAMLRIGTLRAVGRLPRSTKRLVEAGLRSLEGAHHRVTKEAQ